MKSVHGVQRALFNGELTARDLIERCLAAIGNKDGEGARTFLRVNEVDALQLADDVDRKRRSGTKLPPFAGIPISVKDLFDVRGEITTAGSLVLRNAAPARSDAAAITRLRETGFILIGRTNMTEFAYSGLGLNPHYGTPLNPYDRKTGRIPGGSTSGGAISITDGMAIAAIGSDTGGSCRIPAAFTGITGWKPTAARIPRQGMLPLSPTLDSVGCMGSNVHCCAALDAAMSGMDALPDLRGVDLKSLRFGILQNVVFDSVEPAVAQAFERAMSRLSHAGLRIEPIEIPEANELAKVGAKGGFAAAESYAWHRNLLEEHGPSYDPRIRARIMRGTEQNAADYDELVQARARLIELAKGSVREVDAIVHPTTPVIAPKFSEITSDDEFSRLNMLVLRNSSIANFFDLCAINLPCHEPGTAPVGMTIVAPTGHDLRLLNIASAIENLLSRDVCSS